jgi:molecular chaperone HtpG
VKQILIWKIVDGEWTTVEDYLERNREKTNDKILYTKDEKQLSHLHNIYKEKNIEVICANSPIDSYVISALEKKITPAKFQRIDGGIDENLIDKSKESSEASKLADFIRSKLSDDKVEVEAKSLATTTLPGFIVIDEDQRRFREYMATLKAKSGMPFEDFGKKTFVVNTNNPLVSAIEKLDQKNPELSQELVKQMYDLSLLSQREMDPNTLNDFIQRSNKVLEDMVKEITG